MIRSIRKPLWFLFSDERWLRGAIAFLDKYARDVITARRKDKDLATREDLLSLFMNKVNPDTNAPYVCDTSMPTPCIFYSTNSRTTNCATSS